ncbi:hypothetical protein [Actinospica robiniae]|uniref:hypothetical protein n=1 Tax=Actinospica robiniae TaxID=304901 RepID=UPI00054D9201|nr:hypothetical protein [Actinospica robiniae]
MKYLRTVSVAACAAAVGLGVGGTATAAVSPLTTTCTTEPLWTNSITVTGTPVQNHEYSVPVAGGTFYAEWSSAWNLAVKYTTSGTLTGTFKYFDIYTSASPGAGTNQSCSYGPGSHNVAGSGSYIFSGSSQPPEPYDNINSGGGTEQEVIAVLIIPNYGTYAIGFPG